MTCQICFNSYDHSIRKPYSLSCPHTFCICCLEKLKGNKCPSCNLSIINKNPNLALLEFIPESSYDKIKAESLKAINEIHEIRNDFNKKRDLKLKEYLDKFNLIRETITSETDRLVNLLRDNQNKLINETNLLETNLTINLAFNHAEDDVAIKVINSKNKLEKNLFTELQLVDLKEETSITKIHLNKLVEQIEQFKKKFDFIQFESIDQETGLLGEIETNEKLFEKFVLKGDETRDKGSFKESIEFYDKAIAICPELPTGFFEKGNSLFKINKYDEAIECYQKCIELDPTYFIFYLNKAVAMIRAQKYDESIEVLDKAIELNPNSIEVYEYKANVYMEEKNYKKALVCYTKALKLDPTNYEYLNSKGISLTHLNQYSEAIKCFDESIELNSTYTNAYISKGKCLLELKEFDAAINEFNKAIQIEPSNTSFQEFKQTAVEDKANFSQIEKSEKINKIEKVTEQQQQQQQQEKQPEKQITSEQLAN